MGAVADSAALIRTTLEPSGVLLAAIDLPGKRMNVFSAELMDAFDALLQRVDEEPAIKAVVLTSGKPTFLAGADLTMVRGFTDAARHAATRELTELCGRLGRLFVRLEASPKPWVAAVNGLALGGGLELAMACRVRLVTDEPRTQLGVPEVRWGLLPGAGGTQRLPRLIGFAPAMRMLLDGQPIGPAQAVERGLFARAVPAEQLLDEARKAALELAGTRYDPASKFPHFSQADVPAAAADAPLQIARANQISDEDLRLYPAYHAIIASVLEGAHLPLERASAVEMKHFLTLMTNPVAAKMMRSLYLEKLKAERAVAIPSKLELTRLCHGQLRSASALWQQALVRTRVPVINSPALPPDTLELTTSTGSPVTVRVDSVERRAFDTASSHPERHGNEVKAPHAVAVLSPAGPYGRVLELVGVPDAEVGALALLAQSLGAMAWRTPGPISVLQQLSGKSLDDQARIALSAQGAPGAGAPSFLDVAACLAGVAPPWSGGPLTHLWAEQERLRPTWDPAHQQLFVALEPTLRRASA